MRNWSPLTNKHLIAETLCPCILQGNKWSEKKRNCASRGKFQENEENFTTQPNFFAFRTVFRRKKNKYFFSVLFSPFEVSSFRHPISPREKSKKWKTENTHWKANVATWKSETAKGRKKE